jgi:hypothetical protein
MSPNFNVFLHVAHLHPKPFEKKEEVAFKLCEHFESNSEGTMWFLKFPSF